MTQQPLVNAQDLLTFLEDTATRDFFTTYSKVSGRIKLALKMTVEEQNKVNGLIEVAVNAMKELDLLLPKKKKK